MDGQVPIEKVCKEWDQWHAYFDWPGVEETGSVLSVAPKDSDRIEWVTLIAVPFSR